MNHEDTLIIACMPVRLLPVARVESEQMECPSCREQIWIALPELKLVRERNAIPICVVCLPKIVPPTAGTH